MKFMLFVLPTVPASLEDRKRLRPIGRNNDRYQQMLDELRKLIRGLCRGTRKCARWSCSPSTSSRRSVERGYPTTA